MSNPGTFKRAALWAGGILAVIGAVKETCDVWPVLEARLNAAACDVTPNCGQRYVDFQWPRQPRNQIPRNAFHL